MPASLLFGLNSEGRVHSLSTLGSAWREMQYVGLDFKRVSAVSHFLWAVGGDRQVYVHVHSLDVPIRVKEEAYENERWLPLEGFSSRLFPTDRYHFSSADGTVDRSIDKIRVPSMAWQWESDWHLDTNLNGQPLDHDGWTYAVDFPAQYHAKKQWKSCVRRRKWVRYRRYSAMNSWCAVAPLHKDPTQEPFIDVSIGGNYLPGAQPGILLVWAVTAHGRVMFRTGVSTTSPEGLRWTNIATPPGCEVNQISVGPTGLVWAVLWNGRALVRSGVTRDNPSGESWIEVRPPGDGLKLSQISVGYNAIWGVTTDNHVWFRKGVSGDTAGISEDAAIGSGWVQMVGNMAAVSVAPNDQVWGIGSEDRCLYFRGGVSSSELTGKTWRQVQAPMQLSRASSTASLGLTGPNAKFHHSLRSEKKHRSWSSLNRPQSTYTEPSSLPTEWEETSRSAPTPTSLRLKQDGNNTGQSPGPESFSEGSENEIPPPSHSESPSTGSSQGDKNQATPDQKGEPFIVSGKHFEQPIKSSKAWSPVRSVGSVVGTEANPESDVWDSGNSRDSGVFQEEDESLAFYWTECDAMWTWVAAGACTVDPQTLPNWFVDVPSLPQTELNEPWRMKLLDELRNRLPESGLELSKYQAAIDMSSWVKRGEARCLPRSHSSHGLYEECIIELEWVSSSTGTMHSGTLTVLNPDGATTKVQFSLSEITCVLCCSEPGNPRLAIFTPNLPNGNYPLRLQFGSDTELEDWLANLTSVCCQMNEVHGTPSDESIWITTALGDVFVFDPALLKINQRNNDHYMTELDVSTVTDPYKAILQNGFGPGSVLTITGCIDDNADRISFNLECHPLLKIRHKAESEVRDVPFHFNPRFDSNCIVRNTMRDGKWDDNEMRDGDMVLQPGLEFMMKIICEESGYRVFVHGKEYCSYNHRLPPESIYQLVILGKLKLFKVIYRSSQVIVAPRDMFWRQMGGHLRHVETSSTGGVVWGIGFDNTAWVYTGGWGGSFLKGLETSSSGINQMSDTQNYYVYENQRWNPVTGYTSTGLPTDRHMWSDVTGKHKRTRDHAKLLSMHWQWISDWLVDFHTPGGVDRDGWQYAVDFPSKYHAKKSFTDMVRRRRWFRRAKLNTSGPWHEVGNSKIVDISLQHKENSDEINVWAIATNGDVLFRRGVTKNSPSGTFWDHVACDQPLCSISAGPQNQVWAVGRNGSAYWRLGIRSDKPEGEVWNNVEPPAGAQLKQVSVGHNTVWGLDTTGRLSIRREITPMFPEGTYWQSLPNIPLEQNNGSDSPTGFRQISIGKSSDQVWAITNNGLLCKRCGISSENPAGNGWIYGINGTWNHVSIKSWDGCN